MKRAVVSVVTAAAALLGASVGAGVAQADSAADAVTRASDGWVTTVDDRGQQFSSSAIQNVTATGSGDVGILSSFTWEADFNARLQSREYSTPNAGNHRIIVNRGENCKSSSGAEIITVELFAQDFPGDDSFGTRAISCQYGGQATWTGVRADTFYFTLTSSYWGATPNRHLTGAMYYP